MKFLVLFKQKPNAQVPPEMFPPILRACKDYIDAHTGKDLDCSYLVLPNENGIVGVAIGTADTAEEAFRSVYDYPLSPFLNVEVYPVADSKKGMDIEIEQAERMLAHA
ncbi:MAG: hypothetical protein ACM3JD_11720 [Rudaea sp.]